MQEIGLLVRSDILLLLFFILLQTEIYSQVYPDESVDSLLRTGIRHIVNQDYKGAEEIINLLNIEFPYLPLGKIYLAANRIAEAYDYAEDFNEEFILKRLEEAKEQSEKLKS